jgi:SAM-dependent methyltransferase
MPLATDRLQIEQAFHDRQADHRTATFHIRPEALQVDVSAYLDHETWLRSAFASLGHVTGRAVLDFGCGHGMAAVVLAKLGARVTGFDLSPRYVHEARRRAEANGVGIHFAQADGDRLPFASQSFDCVWGSAILHHLDLRLAGAELQRILRPGGVGVFCEPWSGNPALNIVRRYIPYPGKERTPDEQPLRASDLAVLQNCFPHVEMRGFQFLSMVRRVLRPSRLVGLLDRWDDGLLTRFPRMQHFCRYMVLTLRK